LEGKQALILGYGVIGRRLARGCLSLGMAVKAVKREGWREGGKESEPGQAAGGLMRWMTGLFQPLAKEGGREEGREGGVDIISLASLHTELPQTTALLIALPETAATVGLIGSEEIALLPPSAVVVNVGRGGVVDEEALYHALKEKRIWAAGLDVWWQVRGMEEGRMGWILRSIKMDTLSCPRF